VLAARGPKLDTRDAVVAVALVALLAAAYRRPLPFGPHAHLMLDTAALLGAALLLPSGIAIPVALAGPLLANLPRREPWSQAVFNGGQAAIQVACAALALGVAGWSCVAPFDDGRFLLAVPVAGLTMYLVNTSAVAAIVALQEGGAFPRVWLRLALLDRTEATGLGAQWGLALLAVIVADGHPWGLILLGLPGIVVFGALDHNARLRLRAEERLVHQAFHDSLTGLPNRARLTDLLEAAIMERHDQCGLAVLFLDLDHFKLVNDTLGHEAGDDLLVEVAARLRSCTRNGHTVARLGGDEFVVIMDGITDTEEPQRVASQIVDALTCRPITLAGHNIVVGASIGIAVAGPEHRTGGGLLRDADLALYRAKEAGRGQIMLFEQAMGWAVRDRLAKEADWLTAPFAPMAKIDRASA
jgi:diguanylate cyclase (GGDEF)-like protein